MAKIIGNPYRKRIGFWGENEAEKYLVGQGLEIIERNFHTREGEIDIIAKDENDVVFIEVKTRTNLNFGFPEEAVTEEKLDHLISAAESYLQKHQEITSWRMDVLSILGKPGSIEPEFEWFKNVE
jgi:putative endonuclease